MDISEGKVVVIEVKTISEEVVLTKNTSQRLTLRYIS